MRIRPRSMLVKVIGVTAAVVILPLTIVLGASIIDAGIGDRMRRRTLDSARQVEALISAQAGPGIAEVELKTHHVAEQWGVRIRVVRADGQLLVDADYEGGGYLAQRIGRFFFGIDRAPTLAELDAQFAPVLSRDESRAALREGEARGCRHSPGRRLEVCHAVLRAATTSGNTYLVYAQESSRRGIRALDDLRYQMLKLTVGVLPLGLVLALWLVWRLVRPVAMLRRQVLERARSAAPTGPIDIGRDDEIGDLAQAFNDLLRTLQERARANEAFVADLAHEFKNPVAAIRASAERLQGGQGVDPERAERLARVVLASCGRLDALVTELLDLARAEAGLPDEARAAVPLDALVGGVAENLRADERYTSMDVRVELPTTSVVVEGIAGRLETALRNLLDNAASFAGEGGWVEVSLRVEDGWAEVVIADSGPGIAAEHLPRVFDRFFTTRGERRGTGLGLALTKAVVEAHGGTVEARSVEGQGAQFVALLPVVEDAFG